MLTSMGFSYITYIKTEALFQNKRAQFHFLGVVNWCLLKFSVLKLSGGVNFLVRN